jgi:hypothetical protein
MSDLDFILQEDGEAIYSSKSEYLYYMHGQDNIILDGQFDIQDLEKILAYIKQHITTP